MKKTKKNDLRELLVMTKQHMNDLKKQGIKEVEVYASTSTKTRTGGKKETLSQFKAQISNCRKCSLAKTRNKFVFGEGPDNAQLIFIGEAPGYEEDQQGRPFVGRAGKLLTKIVEAMKFQREDVFICNILKCRPPNNRTPSPDEIKACRSHLIKQLSLLKNKKAICVLGLPAAQGLLDLELPMYKMRGHWYEYEGTPVMITYHPAYLLRNPAAKSKVWYDVKKVKAKCSEK